MTSKLSRTPARSIELSLTVAEKKAELPDTGLDATTGALSALVLGVLGAVALIATRRRNA